MRSSSRVPASVGETLRVVRCNRRMPRVFSSPIKVWLRVERESPNSSAALRKLRWWAIAAKASRSLNAGLVIGVFSAQGYPKLDD